MRCLSVIRATEEYSIGSLVARARHKLSSGETSLGFHHTRRGSMSIIDVSRKGCGFRAGGVLSTPANTLSQDRWWSDSTIETVGSDVTKPTRVSVRFELKLATPNLVQNQRSPMCTSMPSAILSYGVDRENVRNRIIFCCSALAVFKWGF